MKRNACIDAYRGLSLVSMLFFHGYYDMVYIFGGGEKLSAGFVYAWQQAIVLSFVFIAGAATLYSHKLLRRGLKLSVLGLGITAATFFAVPSELIIFGVLSFLGAALILLSPFRGKLQKFPAGSKCLLGGLIFSLLGFILTQGLPVGYLGFYGKALVNIPLKFSSPAAFVLGLPTVGIISADYVPIFPHIFIFLAGRFFWQYMGAPEIPLGNNIFTVLGRHSLAFYLLHQPVLYGLGCLCRYMGTRF